MGFSSYGKVGENRGKTRYGGLDNLGLMVEAYPDPQEYCLHLAFLLPGVEFLLCMIRTC